MNIYGFIKSTLLDYPKHLAATLFVGGCNFRCPFCHNGGLVLSPIAFDLIPESDIFAYLRKRTNILEGVCITGGEPTLYEDLPLFIDKIKDLGYKVKLDTNGYNPNMLKLLCESKRVDYIAMDIKNSPQNYSKTAGLSTIHIPYIQQSVDILRQGSIEYEFRTTLTQELHTANDMELIGRWLANSNAYYLQCYKDSPNTIAPNFHAPSKESLKQYLSILQTYIPNTSLRGVD